MKYKDYYQKIIMNFFDNLFQDSLLVKKQIKDIFDGHYKIINFWGNFGSNGKNLFKICFNHYFDSGIEIKLNYLDKKEILSEYFFKNIYWYYSTNMGLLHDYFKNDANIDKKLFKTPCYLFIEADLDYQKTFTYLEKISDYLQNGLIIKNNNKTFNLSNLFIVLTSYAPIEEKSNTFIYGLPQDTPQILNINFPYKFTKEPVQDWEKKLLQFERYDELYPEFDNWYLKKIIWSVKTHKYFTINEKKLVKLCLLLYRYINPFIYLPRDVLYIIIKYILS